jgi:translation initiation factor 1
MKLSDLSKLSTLLSPEESEQLAREHAAAKAKRTIGEGQDVRVFLDTKARRGKAVTIIADLHLSSEMRDKLAKDLKQKLSAGGTVHNDTIEIQGDHIRRAAEYLEANGFKVRNKK